MKKRETNQGLDLFKETNTSFNGF